MSNIALLLRFPQQNEEELKVPSILFSNFALNRAIINEL